MREGQLRAGNAPPKKQDCVFEELQAQRHRSIWKGAVRKELVKAHAACSEHLYPGRRCLSKWDPPSTLFAG